MASTDDDEEYIFDESGQVEPRIRYPLHDCCEFEDAESLKEDDDDDDEQDDNEEGHHQGTHADDESSSSEDSNDSTAAARAAAIGHSPLPVPGTIPTAAESENDINERTDGVNNKQTTEESKEEKSSAQAVADHDGKEDVVIAEPKTSEADRQTLPSHEQIAHDGDVEHSMVASKVGDEGKPEVQEFTDIEMAESNQTLDKSSDVEEVNGKQHSANKKVVKYYCPYNVNQRDPDENTPLHVAILARKLEHVRLLLQAGASVHKRCDGSWPIHTAISVGGLPQHADFAFQCVTALHEYGADLTCKDDSMHTPLYLACMYNLPAVAGYVLSTEAGRSTLNLRSDRSSGRPLHAAAKFDTRSGGVGAAGRATGNGNGVGANVSRTVKHHHPDGTVANAVRQVPGFPGKLERLRSVSASAIASKQPHLAVSTSAGVDEAVLTRLLLDTTGIEIDAKNSVGQTPLHIACLRGNWPVVRCLIDAGASPDVADLRGFTPGELAHKRGMPIPQDLLDTLGDPPSSGTVAPPRDLIVDPHGATLIISHELCKLHRTCSPIRRNADDEPPPENVRRLHVLIDEDTGILRCGEFSHCTWKSEARRAAMTDVLKVHEYNYIESISRLCTSIPDHPTTIAHLDADTTISRWSFEAALRAAGGVCDAVDKVVSGEFRNAFCPVRPPGHHAGPRGIVRCTNDPEGGSHGFCLLNNVAIGAAYARTMYRNDGIQKIAIIDFDVHHGNGTEEIIRQLVPGVDKSVVRTPFAVGELASTRYRPWLDETDVQNVFFASTHGYGPRGSEIGELPHQPGWFYPGSGKTHTSDAIVNPSIVEAPNVGDFLLSQTWTRMSEESRLNCCKIIDCGLALPGRDDIPGMQRLRLRDTYRKTVLPNLRDFDPDLIFISAGFDAHRRDTMNFGYVGMVEDDYEWITEQLVKIANTCCNGRIISVLEGGYKIHGGLVSPFARSVASHVRGLVDGGMSRELYDLQDGEWESQFERHLVEERAAKRQVKEELRTRPRLTDLSRRHHSAAAQRPPEQEQSTNAVVEEADPDLPSRKRRRNHVDYRELYEQMKREGFAT